MSVIHSVKLSLLFLVTWSGLLLVSSEIYFKKGAPHVKLANGLLRGKVQFSRDGRPYNAFAGIPYATVPERFQPPQPNTETWTDIKSFVTPGNMCPQQQFEMLGFSMGDEDCLNLNVYVPQNSTGKRGFPVMVWIHGGGFNYGAGSGYGAKYFMDEDIILITFNYRLGAFGFLSTGDGVISGNNGMKDQVMALKWVQENVKAFGGDPTKVTIFGESAGGASAVYLMHSPSAKGLFHRVIAQSGANLGLWAYQSKPRDNAVKLATHLKCSTTAKNPSGITSQEILTCLRTVSTEELNTAQFAFKESWPGNFHSFFFTPTAEPEPTADTTDTPFLTELPGQLLAKEKYQADVPLLIGANEDEGCVLYAGIILKHEKLISELETTWDSIAAQAFNYDEHSFSVEQQAAMTKKIREFYFGTSPISTDTRQALSNLYSDQLVLHGVYRAAVETAARGKKHPVYLYQYAYPGPISLLGMSFQIKEEEATKKVGHGDELLHLFDFGHGQSPIGPDTPDEEFSKNLVKLWVSFAIHGEPRHSWGSASLRQWKPISKKELDGSIPLRWYRLDSNPAFVDDPYRERMAFWDKLLEDFYGPSPLTKNKQSQGSDKTEL